MILIFQFSERPVLNYIHHFYHFFFFYEENGTFHDVQISRDIFEYSMESLSFKIRKFFSELLGIKRIKRIKFPSLENTPTFLDNLHIIHWKFQRNLTSKEMYHLIATFSFITKLFLKRLITMHKLRITVSVPSNSIRWRNIRWKQNF